MSANSHTLVTLRNVVGSFFCNIICTENNIYFPKVDTVELKKHANIA